MEMKEKKTQKKLLVLDMKGLLFDTCFSNDKHLVLPLQPRDATIGNFYVYKRPFCDEFLRFCFDNFVVGVWSSSKKQKGENLVDYIFQEAKHKLAFVWHQEDCNATGLCQKRAKRKPPFMKELSKVWERLESSPNLGIVDEELGPSNTLLVDSSLYSALLNSPHTAIFPRHFKAHDTEDILLRDELRSYLEGIRDSVDVQDYVKENPFGEPCISARSRFWEYFKDALRFENHAHYVKLEEDPQLCPAKMEDSDTSIVLEKRAKLD